MPGHDDLWDNLMKGAAADYSGGHNESIDIFLQDDVPPTDEALEDNPFMSVRGLTDKAREANALGLPVKAGTRVSFVANLGAVMTYQDPPMPKSKGTVVEVKSASGMVTSHAGKVFVAWDDGKTRGIHAQHLRLVKKAKRAKTQDAHVMRVASLGDLTEFLKVADDTLIHRSTRDLWSFRRDGTDYVIERLFESNGDPLKG